jgi:hypothetical protein
MGAGSLWPLSSVLFFSPPHAATALDICVMIKYLKDKLMRSLIDKLRRRFSVELDG